MGFPDVAKFHYRQSFHTANDVFGIMIDESKRDALPAELEKAVSPAGLATSAGMQLKSMDRMSTDLIAMQRDRKLLVIRTPQAILAAQLAGRDKVLEKRGAENPSSARIVESQKASARRVGWRDDTVTVSARLACNHFFRDGVRGQRARADFHPAKETTMGQPTDSIADIVKSLAPEQQRMVLEFARFLAQQNVEREANAAMRSTWAVEPRHSLRS